MSSALITKFLVCQRETDEINFNVYLTQYIQNIVIFTCNELKIKRDIFYMFSHTMKITPIPLLTGSNSWTR